MTPEEKVKITNGLPSDALGGAAVGKQHEPFYGHPLKPIPVYREEPKTVREQCYMEHELSEFLSEYAMRGGMTRSHALRRLCILGAMSEGYKFDNGSWRALQGDDVTP